MLNNLIFAKRKSLFEKALNNGEVLDEAIVFIEDTKEIWNHGVYFDCSTFDHSSFESTEEWVNQSKHIKFFDLSASLTSTQVEELNSYLSLSVGSYSSNPIYPVVRFKLNHEDCTFNNGILLSCRTLNRINTGPIVSGAQNTYYNLTIAYSTESNYFENNSSSSIGGEVGGIIGGGVVVGPSIGGGVVVGPSIGGTTTGSSTSLDNYKNYMMIAEVFITISNRSSMTSLGVVFSYEYSGVEGVNIYPMYVLTSGEGAKFLSDDGTYKEISVDIPLVNHGTNDITFTLTPNTFHMWDTVSLLDLSLGEELENVINEFLFQFTSGETPTTLILPDTIKWVNDAPEIEANMTYQCSIINNIGVICGAL